LSEQITTNQSKGRPCGKLEGFVQSDGVEILLVSNSSADGDMVVSGSNSLLGVLLVLGVGVRGCLGIRGGIKDVLQVIVRRIDSASYVEIEIVRALIKVSEG
jgi:hypothetical protein